MDNESKTKIQSGFKKTVESYFNLSTQDNDKAGVLKILTQEQKAIADYENHEIDLDIKKRKINLEEDTAKEQKSLNIQKHGLEILKSNEQIKIDKSKLNLDKAKFKAQNEIEKIKIDIEQTKVNLELEKFKLESEMQTKKLELEYLKISKEDDNRKLDEKKFEWGLYVSIGTAVLGTFVSLISLLTYNNHVKNMLRLIYMDDGRVPTEMRDMIAKLGRFGK